MYEAHFGLGRAPFALTPDTGFFFANRAHVEALDVLRVALDAGEGFIKVTGEVGTGKTLLCRTLLNGLGEGWMTAYLPNPQLPPAGLRQSIAAELGVSEAANLADARMIPRLQSQLIHLAQRGLRVVVVVDEAQALSAESLEALRLLSNLETETAKLVQVVLFGQPELDARLARPDLRQLRQRIGFAYRLAPLDRAGVALYVEHRLRVAGASAPVFSAAALAELYRGSGGIPRLVNVLAHKSLMLAYGRGDRQVGRNDVRIATRDTESARAPSRLRWWPWPTRLALLAPALATLGQGLLP